MNKRSVIIVASFVLAIIALFVVRTQATKRATGKWGRSLTLGIQGLRSVFVVW
jgi:hypothetical protein